MTRTPANENEVPVRLIDADRFPITIRIFGQHGREIWTHVVAKPDNLVTVRIPGFAGTEHVPTRVRIEYADGSVEE